MHVLFLIDSFSLVSQLIQPACTFTTSYHDKAKLTSLLTVAVKPTTCPSYTCSYCSRALHTKRQLVAHMTSHDLDKDKCAYELKKTLSVYHVIALRRSSCALSIFCCSFFLSVFNFPPYRQRHFMLLLLLLLLLLIVGVKCVVPLLYGKLQLQVVSSGSNKTLLLSRWAEAQHIIMYLSVLASGRGGVSNKTGQYSIGFMLDSTVCLSNG